jgi:SAM-dependent methyltransferase
MKISPYDQRFYQDNGPGSSRSAAEVVPYVVSLVRPASVVDVGCGSGTWTAEFLRCGVSSVLGIDGEYVDRGSLRISPSDFLAADLETPLNVPKTFDLAISMEVAEHLSASRAESFVEDLTKLAPFVLFSAAIPTQFGRHHINLQWQSYWQALFSQHRYQAVDCLRPRFWSNQRISFWYRQNMLLYVDEDRAGQFAQLAASGPLDVVHPEMLVWQQRSPKCLMRSVPGSLKYSASWLLHKYFPRPQNA